jgi:hypothetical protein
MGVNGRMMVWDTQPTWFRTNNRFHPDFLIAWHCVHLWISIVAIHLSLKKLQILTNNTCNHQSQQQKTLKSLLKSPNSFVWSLISDTKKQILTDFVKPFSTVEKLN